MQRGELRDERKADAGARRFGAVRAREELEDGLAALRRHAGAAVGDGELDALAGRRDRHQDLRARRRVLDRVGEQVLDDALHLRRVDVGDRGLGADVHLVAFVAVPGGRMRDELAHVGRPERRHVDAVAQAVEVEQVGEQSLEARRLLDEVVDDRRVRPGRQARGRAPSA